MKRIRTLLRLVLPVGAAAVLVLRASLLAFAQEAPPPSRDLVEPRGSGVINWSAGYVEATGQGAVSGNEPTPVVARLAATRAARADALRNLLEAIKGVRVTGETYVENYMTASDKIRTSVEGIVKGATEKERTFDGQLATVTLRIPLWGNLADNILGADALPAGGMNAPASPYTPQGPGTPTPAAPPAEKPGGGMRGSLWQEGVFRTLARLILPTDAWAAEGGDAPAPPEQSPALQEELKKTGLILDLTGTPAKPELFPRIVDMKTGAVLVDARALGKEGTPKGAIGYAASVDAAREQTDRVGVDPLVIKAINFAAGTSEGFRIELAAGYTAALSSPVEALKKGVTIAYQMAW